LGVDDHDEHIWTGWSVPVVAPCRTIARPAEVAVCHALPWGPDAATTPDRRYVAVRIGLLSGWRTELRGA